MAAAMASISSIVAAVAGALAGGDHRVGVEEGEVARQLGDGAVGGDGVGAVLDVAVGEDPDVVGLRRGAVAQRLGGLALDQALVGDIGVGPLVDADEAARPRPWRRRRRGWRRWPAR